MSSAWLSVTAEPAFFPGGSPIEFAFLSRVWDTSVLVLLAACGSVVPEPFPFMCGSSADVSTGSFAAAGVEPSLDILRREANHALAESCRHEPPSSDFKVNKSRG